MAHPRVAVIGGGINGAGIAWELARRDYAVTLFDRGEFGGATSSASTKLIHGGLRYLESFELPLVYEALHERTFLLRALPDLVRPIELIAPVYADSPRGLATMRFGMALYDLLAGRDGVRNHRVVPRASRLLAPLRRDGLRGALSFFDAQVDDRELVRRTVRSAERDGAVAHEHVEVMRVAARGSRWSVTSSRGEEEFAGVVVALGPWTDRFLRDNALASRYRLTLVRGSHIVVDRPAASHGWFLQLPDDRRIFFVLPWKGKTMIGTTEAAQQGLDAIEPSDEEIGYLIAAHNLFFLDPVRRDDVVESFAGVRPLIGEAGNLSAISREYRLERIGTRLHVFGGKLTTYLSLARHAGDEVDAMFGMERMARPPEFAD